MKTCFLESNELMHIFMFSLNRCNNVLYLRGVPEDEEIEDAEQDWDVNFAAVVLVLKTETQYSVFCICIICSVCRGFIWCLIDMAAFRWLKVDARQNPLFSY